MKRIMALLIAAIMLCGMSAGFAEEMYMNIRQLREAMPMHWEKSFETKWRNVDIGADILMPEAEKLPVVLVAGGASQPTLAAEEAKWDSIQFRGAYDLLLTNNDGGYPKSVDGIRVSSPVSKGSWYGNFDTKNTYVPMDDITLGEIIAMAKERIEMLGYDSAGFAWESPLQIWAHHIYAAGTMKDILPGYIFMRISPKIVGVPVISHIFEAVAGQSTNRTDEFFQAAETSVCYNGYTDELSHIGLSPLKVVETLAEDIPLCSFDKVIASVEKEINAGHIRKVYEIKLGYVLYNQPGVYREAGVSSEEARAAYEAMMYFAKPMWQVNCLYAANAQGELREVSDDTDDERNSLDYRQLLIDAQTGEIVRESDAKRRCEFNGFVSWDEVR